MELGRIGRLDVVRDEEDIVDELYVPALRQSVK